MIVKYLLSFLLCFPYHLTMSKKQNLFIDAIFNQVCEVVSQSQIDRESFRLVFLLHDAGETKAMEPLMDLLDELSLEYSVVTLGAATSLLGSSRETRELDRELELADEQTIVIVGLQVRGLGQTKQAFRSKGARLLGYYDSFEPVWEGAPASEMLHYVDDVLVPSSLIRDTFLHLNPTLSVYVVGHPSLERWNRPVDEGSQEKIIESLGVQRDKTMILYAGGYGPGYDEAFRSFAKAVSPLEGCQVVVAIHPKMCGIFEREVMEQEMTDTSSWIIAPKSLMTEDLVRISDVIISHRSTVGIQAVFMGKAVIYLDVSGTVYKNLAISAGWVKQLTSPEEVRELLAQNFHLTHSVAHQPQALFREMGIPQNASRKILSQIARRARHRSFSPIQKDIPNVIEKLDK